MYMSERHQEGLAHLLYGIQTGGGFVALTGEVGTGKTTLCRCLLQQLPDKIDIALILNPKLNALELLSSICDELGIDYDEQEQSLKNFIDKINEYLLNAYSKGRTTVLLIDEAQNLSLEVLEQIRLLTNLETSKAKLLQIVLVGQPELQQLLNRKELRQLNQRITARYHLLPLSLEETRAYIRHRLSVCKGNPNLFKDSAIRKIFQFSSGIPRVINVLCDRAMLGAYAMNARKITPTIVTHAAKETLGMRDRNWAVMAITALLIIGGGIAAGVYLNPQPAASLLQTGFPFLQKVRISDVDKTENKPSPGPQAVTQEVVRKTETQAFDSWLAQADLSLAEAIKQALLLWDYQAENGRPLSCASLPEPFRCSTEHMTWKELLELDRPAILEFSQASEQKRYVLLTGIDKGNAIFHLNGELRFPLAEVMKYWNGNSLIVWTPPWPGLLEINQLSRAEHVLWLREQLSMIEGSDNPNNLSPIFDQSLKTQVMAFQRKHHLATDGIAGVRTLIHLENETKPDQSPHLKVTN